MQRALSALVCCATLLPACRSTPPVAGSFPSDQSCGPASEIVLLDHGRAGQVAGLVEVLAADRVTGSVRLTAVTTDAIMVQAWGNDVTILRRLIRRFDRPGGGPSVQEYLMDQPEASRFLRDYSVFVPFRELGEYRNRYTLVTTLVPLEHRDKALAAYSCKGLGDPGPVGRAVRALPEIPELGAFVFTDFGAIVWKLATLARAQDD